MVEKSKESLFFQDYKKLVLELFTGRMVKIAYYYPKSKKYGTGGLYYNVNDLRLEINHLPQRGYHISPIDEKDFAKSVCVFSGTPLSYEEAVFWSQSKPLILFNIYYGVAFDCHISWESMGTYSRFVARFSDGSKKYFASEDYEHEYVFLDYNEKQ